MLVGLVELYYGYTGAVALALSLLLPFVFILVVTPAAIERLVEANIVVKDMYKRDLPDIPTGGGILILLVVMPGLSFGSLLFQYPSANYAFIMVLGLFGLFGVLDDMMNIGRAAKLVLMYFCAYPLIQYTPEATLPLMGGLGVFYLQVVVPTYVLVSANLVNMHSGYNGLAAGTSAIILAALLVKTLLVGDLSVAYVGAVALDWGSVPGLTPGVALTMFAAALVVGYLSMDALLRFARKTDFSLFCIALGALTLALFLLL